MGDLTKIDDDRLHMPIAADMCQASADLLYAEPPTLGSDETAVQTELDLAIEGGLFTALASGAEIGAALGDCYLRVTWDQALSDRSLDDVERGDADHHRDSQSQQQQCGAAYAGRGGVQPNEQRKVPQIHAVGDHADTADRWD